MIKSQIFNINLFKKFNTKPPMHTHTTESGFSIFFAIRIRCLNIKFGGPSGSHPGNSSITFKFNWSRTCGISIISPLILESRTLLPNLRPNILYKSKYVFEYFLLDCINKKVLFRVWISFRYKIFVEIKSLLVLLFNFVSSVFFWNVINC